MLGRMIPINLLKLLKLVLSITLFGETFARETFANFANFGLLRESLSREKFEIVFISRKI